MAAAPKYRLVVSCPPNHPSGQRSRAGYTFSKVPIAINCSKEEADLITADPYLTVHRRTSRAWFLAHGLDYSQENLAKYEKVDPKLKGKSKESTIVPGSTEDGGKGDDANKTKDPPPASLQGSGGGAAGQGASKSPVFDKNAEREDIVEALVKFKGQKEGTDFSADATRDSLLAIYQSLPDVEPKA